MVLLQREIPEEVNGRVASVASKAGVPVLLDCGGVEGPIASQLMHSITTLSPNETELARLTGRPSGHMPADGYYTHPLSRTVDLEKPRASWDLVHG
jgi:sugar/nucleoside kinase (ribokinase family)